MVTIGVALISLEAISVAPVGAVEKDIQGQVQVHFQGEVALWAGPSLGELSELPLSGVPAQVSGNTPINQPGQNFFGTLLGGESLARVANRQNTTPKVSDLFQAENLGQTPLDANYHSTSQSPVSSQFEPAIAGGCLTEQCNATTTGSVNVNAANSLPAANSLDSQLTTSSFSEPINPNTFDNNAQIPLANTLATVRELVLEPTVENKPVLVLEVRELSVPKSVSEPSALLGLVAVTSFWRAKRKGNKLS